MNRIISLLFTCLLLAPAALEAQFDYVTNNGTITITGYTGSDSGVVIPSVISGLPVVDIGANAFAYNLNLVSVTIPGSILDIGTNAFFDCYFLTNVTLSLGLADIESSAFFECGLTSITIPDSAINVGQGAFSACYSLTAIDVDSGNPAYASIGGVLFNKSGMTLVQFPGGFEGSYAIPLVVTNIQSDAFEGCALTNVTIPPSVTSIGAGAFNYCLGLTNVTLSLGLTDIESNAFQGDYYITSVIIPDSVTNIGDYAFYGCFSLTNATLGNSLVHIGTYAFSGPYSEVKGPRGCPLTSITIPASVTKVGCGAFEYCWVLTNVMLSLGLTNIEPLAFAGCSSLAAINVNASNPFYSSVGGVLFNYNRTTLVEYPDGSSGNYTIPNTVTNIADYAFYECDGLTNVTLDNSLIDIGAYAFSGPYLPVGEGEGSVDSCPLTSVTIPNSVTNIGDGAFYGCWWLNGIYFQGNAPTVDSEIFLGDLVTAYYLPGTTGWSEFAANADIPTELWLLPTPLILNDSVRAPSNQFGFTISWATNIPVVVEASEDLAEPVWTPIATNILTAGVSSFTDPGWTNYPNRFYRLHAQ
jgi:hypothetical protein